MKPAEFSGSDANPARTIIPAETKIGVAVRLEGYEYLSESAEGSSAFQRVSALHEHNDEKLPPAVRPTTG